MTIQEATEQLIQAIREDMLAKLTGGLARGPVKAAPAQTNGHGSISSTVLAFVRSNKGCGRAQIVAGTGLNPAAVTSALASLRRQGKVKANGQRRFATWGAK